MSPSSIIQTGKEVSREGPASSEEKNPLETRTPTRDEVISSSQRGIFTNMQISNKEPANPDFREETTSMRQLIQVALTNEGLLERFTLPQQNNQWKWSREHLPTLVRDLTSKAGMSADEEQLKSYCDIFEGSGYRTINLYLRNAPKENLYKAICEYADAYFQTKYAVGAVAKAKAVIERYFPTVFCDFPVKVDIYHLSGYEGAEAIAGGGKCQITLWTAEPLANQRNYEDLETKGIFGEGYRFRRRTVDLLQAIHEYAHGIYGKAVEPLEAKMSKEEYYETADAALNEGFAVFIELLSCDMLATDAKKLGLDKRDLQDLQEWKAQRIRGLHRHFKRTRSTDARERKLGKRGMAYTEGTVKFIHKIYKKGGLEGIGKFLRAIDPEKTLAIKRTSEEYRRALGDAEGYKIFLVGGG